MKHMSMKCISMKRTSSCLALLVSLYSPMSAWGQGAAKAVLNLPSKVEPNAPVIASTVGSVSDESVQVVLDPSSTDSAVTLVPIATSGENSTWTVVGALTSFPKDGTYRLVAIARSGKLYAVASKDVTVSSGPLPPVPPGPNPPVPPGPTPHGLARIIVVYETTQAMTKGQFTVLHSTSFYDWMDANVGKDGSTNMAAWRIWDKDVEVPASSPDWKTAWDAVKPSVVSKQLPVVVVFGSDNSFQIFTLPDTLEATIAAISQFKSGGSHVK